MSYVSFNIAVNNSTGYYNVQLPKNSRIVSIVMYNAQSAMTLWCYAQRGYYTTADTTMKGLIWSWGYKPITAVGTMVQANVFNLDRILIPDGKMSFWEFSSGNMTFYNTVNYEVGE